MSFILAACSGTLPTAIPTSTLSPVPTLVPTSAPTFKIMRLGRNLFPDVLDPQKASQGAEIEALKFCYEGLLAIDAKSNIGPGSADTYRLAPDGKSMTFHIREGLVRADGSAMNATDFEYALKREADPRITGKQYTELIDDIAGAIPLTDVEGQKISDADLAKLYAGFGVKSDDSKRELTITFTQPNGYWQYIAFTLVTFSPDKKKVDAAPDNWWSKADGHNCYGPFTIKSIEQGKQIVYEPNASYWRGKARVDRIQAIYIGDDAQRLEAYKRGELDEVDVAATTYAQVQDDANLRKELIRYPAARTIILAFNNARKPFDDKNVRLAFAQAFDRDGWIRDVSQAIGAPTTRWVPPGVPAAQTSKPGSLDYNPQAAVDTLVKSGYGTPDGKRVDCAKIGPVKLTFASSLVNNDRYQFLANNFTRVFNCPIPLDPVDPTVYVGMTRDPKTTPQISRQGWIENFPHPKDWLSTFWKCSGFAKRFAYCNKEVDTQLVKADQTLDFDQSLKEYSKAEEMILADNPAIFVNHSEHLYLVKPYLIGLRDNLSSFDFEWVGEWGPIWTYDVDLGKVPQIYPKK